MKPYLVVFNLVSAVGWLVVLLQLLDGIRQGRTPGAIWAEVKLCLLFTQSLAAAEVVHSVMGLVSSPVGSTAVQVLSRYGVLWGYSFMFDACQNHWSFLLMAASWSLVEVPRYLFYAANLVGTVPYPLFWLRYSLFAILYPSGISGELLQIWTALPHVFRSSIPWWYGTLFLLFLYIPGSPFMFTHMIAQRKKAFKARADKKNPVAAPPSSGVDFPLDEKGQRSTTAVNQGAFVASVAKVDPVASAAAAKERNWRFGYAKHVVKNVAVCCKSEETCLAVCRDGLDYIHSQFEFVRPGQPKMTVMEAMRSVDGTFYTYEIVGTGTRSHSLEYTVPYQKFGQAEVKNLRGKELIAQLDLWVKKGVIEPDARDAVANMVSKPELHSTSLSDTYFVLLGANSAMGPLRVLLELGANIIAVDINRKPVWERLVNMARASPGRMIFPVSKPRAEITDDSALFSCAGADLLNQTPQIARWISSTVPGKRLVVGGYAYLDSALFVRLAVAMDAIMATVLSTRKDAALAFLCSPTDCFVTDRAPADARRSAIKNLEWWQSLLRCVLPKRMLVQNALPTVKGEDGATEYDIVDGLAVAQGPNYALAKRLQHWRCMLARSQGHTVSTNIAPSTATASVVHNPQFAAAYEGMQLFKPMEIVYQDLSNAIMTALLLNDIFNPTSAARPASALGNQIRLFSKTSCHFGIWRMAFKCGSIGEVSAAIGYAKIYRNGLTVAAAVFVACLGLLMSRGAPHTW